MIFSAREWVAIGALTIVFSVIRIGAGFRSVDVDTVTVIFIAGTIIQSAIIASLIVGAVFVLRIGLPVLLGRRD